MWMNLGTEKKPKASRRSRYFAEWCRANGGKAPLRGDRMSVSIFTGRMCRVVVADSQPAPCRKPKEAGKPTPPPPPYVPYSVVAYIISWETGGEFSDDAPARFEDQEQANYRFNESRNQLIKENKRESTATQRLTGKPGQKLEQQISPENYDKVKTRRTRESEARSEGSALAGVESSQLTSTQGTGGEPLSPVKGKYSTLSANSPLVDDEARARREGELKAQAERLQNGDIPL